MEAHQVDFYVSARDTWLQTLQVMVAIQQKVLTREKWPQDFFVTTGPGAPGLNLRFPEGPEGQRDLEDWAQNTMVATFAMFAMAADAALQEASGSEKNPLCDSDPKRRSLWCIWHMIRCAFAHPSAGVPTWECRRDYRASFTLPGSFTIDGVLLHGQPFSIDQLGGLDQVSALLRITDEALNVPALRQR